MNFSKLNLLLFFVVCVAGIVGAQTTGKGEDISAKNTQIGVKNVAMQRAVQDGAAAFARKDYAGAIDIFQQAFSADPTHPAAAILMKNIAAVKLQRGIETFNKGNKEGDDAMMSASKPDLLDAETIISRALMLAKTNNYTPDKIAPIIDVQKQVFSKISYVFFYIGSLNSDNTTLQKSADAAKAFLALAAANDPNRAESEQVLAELKSSHNIVPK
jgi:tetratricopeptide (TPR) repeat protein